jgi:hypothetical protein
MASALGADISTLAESPDFSALLNNVTPYRKWRLGVYSCKQNTITVNYVNYFGEIS